MSGSYAYALLEGGVPITGGPKLYHVKWHLNDNSVEIRKENLECLKNGELEVWRLTPHGAANISQKIIKGVHNTSVRKVVF